jgi:hypothetical protein
MNVETTVLVLFLEGGLVSMVRHQGSFHTYIN